MKNPTTRIDRRTLLRGVGVAMGLPWLESIPAWGGEAGPAAPPRRFAALFMGNGISPNHWWAKGSSAGMELGKSLQPLAPLRSKLNVVSGLFNKHADGRRHPPPARPATSSPARPSRRGRSSGGG